MAALAVEQAHLAVEQAHLTVQQAVVTQPHAVTMAAHANETQVPRKDRVNEWLKGDAELLRYEQLLAAPKGSGSALRRLSEEKRLPEKTLEGRLKRARQRRDGAEWQAEQDGEERQTKHARYQRAKAAQLSAEVKAACTAELKAGNCCKGSRSCWQAKVRPKPKRDAARVSKRLKEDADLLRYEQLRSINTRRRQKTSL